MINLFNILFITFGKIWQRSSFKPKYVYWKNIRKEPTGRLPPVLSKGHTQFNWQVSLYKYLFRYPPEGQLYDILVEKIAHIEFIFKTSIMSSSILILKSDYKCYYLHLFCFQYWNRLWFYIICISTILA